jgi:hypothetical protein
MNTKKQREQAELPAVKARYEQDGRPDYHARSESWGAYTDALCKNGDITDAQYMRWSAPKECGK